MQRCINFGYRLVNTKPSYNAAPPEWLIKENTHSEKIIAIAWEANLSPFSKMRAIKKLKETIKFYAPECNVIVIGTSLGGLIATEALRDFSAKEVSNLILIGAINAKRCLSLEGIKILNIFSTDDSLAKLATRLLAPLHGSQELEGEDVVNIQIDNVRHDEFLKDIEISSGIYQRQKIGQIISAEVKANLLIDGLPSLPYFSQ